MLDFQRILVYYNTLTHKSHALERAARIAQRSGARLKLIDVVDESSPLLRKLLPDGVSLEEQSAAERHQRLEQAAAVLRRREVKVETVLARGTPFAEVIREAIRGEHDLVLKTADPDGTTRLFGTTAMHLMRKCPCPVWIVKPAGEVYGPRILAAVDPMATDSAADELHREIMEVARALAVLEGGELHVAHAWQPPYAKTLAGTSRVPEERLAEYVRDAQEKVREVFRDFVERFEFRLPRRRVHLLRGEPGAVIPRFAERRQVNVIVMGTTARSGIAGMLIGNSAERILGQVECSVVTLKPRGFVSPVTVDNNGGG